MNLKPLRLKKLENKLTDIAPAKINLYLHITGKRNDGYHELDSLVVFPEIGDNISIEKADGIELSSYGPFSDFLPSTSENIVIRAAKWLKAVANVKVGAKITLCKNLPVSSGVGGGSSDAATVISLLKRFWNVSLDQNKLMKSALSLGADIPVCLKRQSSYIGGVGEVLISPPTIPAFWLVLVNPGIPVETAKVFSSHSPNFSPISRFNKSPKDAQSLAVLLSERKNDLENSAISLFPEIAEVLNSLANIPNILISRMSGSGATCFGLFEDPSSAKLAEQLLKEEHPAWWIKKTQLMP